MSKIIFGLSALSDSFVAFVVDFFTTKGTKKGTKFTKI